MTEVGNDVHRLDADTVTRITSASLGRTVSMVDHEPVGLLVGGGSGIRLLEARVVPLSVGPGLGSGPDR